RAVALYGSAARGGAEHSSAKSDYNVLVLVSSLPLDALRREGPAAKRWRAAGNPPPLTMTLNEWTRCADIFPMEYADILQHHRVLYGTLPLDGISVDPGHLRLQLENEAMGKLLRLRHQVMTSLDDAGAQLALLEASLSAMLTLFRAYARLHSLRADSDSEALCRSVAAHAGFDADPFVRAWHHLKGTNRITKEAAPAVLASYLESLQSFVARVDQYVT
ncbi:MAG: hypothetical protein ACT4R6_01360, partial [Gemmatimonadaceae bacterium]